MCKVFSSIIWDGPHYQYNHKSLPFNSIQTICCFLALITYYTDMVYLLSSNGQIIFQTWVPYCQYLWSIICFLAWNTYFIYLFLKHLIWASKEMISVKICRLLTLETKIQVTLFKTCLRCKAKVSNWIF